MSRSSKNSPLLGREETTRPIKTKTYEETFSRPIFYYSLSTIRRPDHILFSFFLLSYNSYMFSYFLCILIPYFFPRSILQESEKCQRETFKEVIFYWCCKPIFPPRNFQVKKGLRTHYFPKM